jgi:hypothetical protein
MAKLTDADKALIDRLWTEGKTCTDISKQMPKVTYTAVWQYINRDFVRAKNRERYCIKVKPINTTSTEKYVEIKRPLPPINPPGPITYIHADRECVNAGLAAEYGSKLMPIVCTLAERKPSLSFTSQDKFA